MEIRRLAQDDAPLLETAVRDLLPSEDRPDAPTSRPHLARALADPGCYLLVCLLEAVPVGYLSGYRFPAIEYDGFLVYLYDIVVHAKHRRRGIATELVAALKQHCRADGVARIWVGTSLGNRAAQRTFEATGAQRVSETYVEYIYDLHGSLHNGAV